MHIFLTVAAMTFLVSPSTAQHPPTPQNTSIVDSAIKEEVGRILFNVFERKTSEELYGHLPTRLAKCDLPTDINSQLPPAHQGTERANAGNDVVLIHQATGVVLDILKDIITK